MRLKLTNHRAVGISIGLLTFVATHLILVARWTTCSTDSMSRGS